MTHQTIDIGIPRSPAHGHRGGFVEGARRLVHAVPEDAQLPLERRRPAPASYHQFAALTVVPEDTDLPDAQEMVRRLVSAHEATARTIRTLMRLAEGAPDQVSVDLLVRRLDVHEKTAWMLRSILA